ncbi:MAG: hypothetical protein LBS62_08040 [Clostridiales bacterium]|nr:hypothetical protein [Clostridiales bacterium]
MSKHWIVQRSFGQLDKCRRLWKNFELLIQNTLNMVKFAFLSLYIKKFLDRLLEFFHFMTS